MKYTRESKPTTYIHYGSSAFSHVKFVPATQEGCWVKPKGGLWGSPIDAQHSWKDWCEGENFRECNEDNSFKFTVRGIGVNPEKAILNLVEAMLAKEMAEEE